MNTIKTMPLIVFAFCFSIALVTIPQTVNAQYSFTPYWVALVHADGALSSTWVTFDGTTGVTHCETVNWWSTGHSADTGGPYYWWTDGEYEAAETSYLGDGPALPRFEISGIITRDFMPMRPIVPTGCWILEADFASDMSLVPGITGTAVMGLRPPDYSDGSCIDFKNTHSQITIDRILPDGTLEPVGCAASANQWASNLFMGTAINRELSNLCPTRPIWVDADPVTGRFARKVAFYIEEETNYNAGCDDGEPRWDEHHSVSMVERCAHRIMAVGTYPAAPPEWVSHLICAPIQPRTDVEHGGALNGGDPVDLVNGDHLYLPAPDIAAYNPYGLGALYRRNYSSACAKAGYFSPGLGLGWVDNFDVRIGQFQGSSDQPDYDVVLAYPTGGQETLVAEFHENGEPTGTFRQESGRPYIADGILDSTHKYYTSINIRWKNGVVWTFTPGWNVGEAADYKPYWLTGIANRLDQKVAILRSERGLVLAVVGKIPGGSDRPLLTFSYTDDGYLKSITDCCGRKVMYEFSDKHGIDWTDCGEVNHRALLSVSQLVDQETESNPPIHWSYGYMRVRRDFTGPYSIQLHANYPLLTKIQFPNPAGSGQTTQTVGYQMDSEGWPRVHTLEDGNGNKSIYEYGPGYAVVKVQSSVYQLAGSGSQSRELLSQKKRYLFDASSDRPTVYEVDVYKDDDTCYSTYYDYSNSYAAGLPSYISNYAVDADSNRSVSIGYDRFGNVTSITTGGGREAEYSYAYTASHPLGCLIEARENGILETVVHYDWRGLVDEIYTLKPTAKQSSNMVYTKTAITYDLLGNIVSITSPRPGAGTPGTATFEYTIAGSTETQTITYDTGVPTTTLTCSYGSDHKIGRPLSVSQDGHVIAQFTYDARGNVESTTNALGEHIDYVLNITDQIEKIEYPSIEM